MPGLGRSEEVEALVDRAVAWAGGRDGVAAVAVVGSWARGAPRAGSDLDLVVLTDDPAAYTAREEWIDGLAPGATLTRTRDWGAIVERRLLLPSGLEVDVGVGLPSWAETSPVDPGTQRVVRDGLRAVYDPRGLLAALVLDVLSADGSAATGLRPERK